MFKPKRKSLFDDDKDIIDKTMDFMYEMKQANTPWGKIIRIPVLVISIISAFPIGMCMLICWLLKVIWKGLFGDWKT